MIVKYEMLWWFFCEWSWSVKCYGSCLVSYEYCGDIYSRSEMKDVREVCNVMINYFDKMRNVMVNCFGNCEILSDMYWWYVKAYHDIFWWSVKYYGDTFWWIMTVVLGSVNYSEICWWKCEIMVNCFDEIWNIMI